MNNEDFHIVADYHQKELMPVVWMGSLGLAIVGVILSLVLILIKNSLSPPIVFLTTQFSFWEIVIMLFFFIGTFLFHELFHAITAWMFHIPTKFGWGMMGKFVPYLSVSLKKPVNRNQWIWIAVMPNFIINVFLAILILITEGELILPFLVILFITHIVGGGGDVALLYTAFKYPSTVLLNDLGLQLQILSKDDLAKKPLINQSSPIVKVFRENRGIYYFLILLFVVLFVTMSLAPVFDLILGVILGYDPEIFVTVVETSELSFTISPNFVSCLIFSVILTPMIWIIRIAIMKYKRNNK